MFHFVDAPHKDAGRSQSRTIRSHAAKNAAARKERVIKYQEEKRRAAADEVYKAASTDLVPRRTAPELNIDVLHLKPSPISAVGAASADPFDSFVRPVTHTEFFLLNHFINYVIINSIGKFVAFNAADGDYWVNRVTRHWIQMASSDSGILAAILSASCCHLNLALDDMPYGKMALAYRSNLISDLREALTKETVPSDLTVTKTMALAMEAIMHNNSTTALHHIKAAILMFKLRGAPIPPERVCQGKPSIPRLNGRNSLLSMYFLEAGANKTQLIPLPLHDCHVEENCFIFAQFLMSQLTGS